LEESSSSFNNIMKALPKRKKSQNSNMIKWEDGKRAHKIGKEKTSSEEK